MKPTLLLSLVLVSISLCACDMGSEKTGDENPLGGGPTGTSNEVETSITVTCDEDLGLNPESGIKIDWMDIEQGWRVAVDGDEITLSRQSSCGDECSTIEEIVLISVDGECPSVLSARSVLHEDMTSQGPMETVTSATEGSLEIQDWDMETGVFSGTLSAEIALTFYATVEK